MSVFTTELVAILWALGWVEEVKRGDVFTCSDSAAALMALKGGRSGARPDLLVEILIILKQIFKLGNTVGFVWVLAHIGVVRNKKADMAAKRTINRKNLDIEVRYEGAECKSLINEETVKLWQKG